MSFVFVQTSLVLILMLALILLLNYLQGTSTDAVNYLCREATRLEMARVPIRFRVANFHRYAKLYESL